MVLSRGLPKTSQATSYATGDDGTYQAGWWQRRLNSNNRQRFIEKTISGDPLVIDRATGLMWRQKEESLAVDWAGAIMIADLLTAGGFDDWRLANIKELISIVDYSTAYPAFYLPFLITDAITLWSSTTFKPSETRAWTVNTETGDIGFPSKTTATYYAMCVRKGV